MICFLAYAWSLTGSAADRGAVIPWTTYEAENMTLHDSTIIGPPGFSKDKNGALPQSVDMESSGRRCVNLDKVGASVQFTSQSEGNAAVVRYCLPDSADGAGLDSNLDLYVNGTKAATLPVTSRYSWRYGNYPFVNDPAKGNPRNFFDEVRIKGLSIKKGDSVKVQRSDEKIACIIDLVDLENIAGPLPVPTNALDVTGAGYDADPTGSKDATAIFQRCITDAKQKSKTVWIPAGTYVISGDLNIPEGCAIQGAGMWHATLAGDPGKYNNERQRVRINGGGGNIHLADFAIVGKLSYRNDSEANDGFSESFGTGSTISRIWVEHTKTGAWVANCSGLVLEGCRFRNTIADGVNFCVGVRSSILRNCTARGTGDDAFAIWPATYTAQTYAPGLNSIANCAAVVTSLGNGFAIYGGESNAIQDCVARDIPFGCGILVAGTFPIVDAKRGIDNKFSGTTVVQRCDIIRSGGWDSGWNAWRGALTICPQSNNIDGLLVSEVTITDSLSYAVQFANPGSQKWLNNAIFDRVTIKNFGAAVPVASATPFCDGAHAVVPAGRGGVAFIGLNINGTAIAEFPASGASMRKATSDFTVAFAEEVAAARLLNQSMAKPEMSSAKSAKPVDGWSMKGAKASDLTASAINGAVIASLKPGAGADLVLTYTAGQQYGIHQIEFVNKLSAADFKDCRGIRLTVTSPNYGRLIVLPRDYESNGRAYEGSSDISLSDQQTYEIAFSSMTKPGWSQGSAYEDAAAALAAGEKLDTLTIGWVCNTGGLEGTVTFHDVELYK